MERCAVCPVRFHACVKGPNRVGVKAWTHGSIFTKLRIVEVEHNLSGVNGRNFGPVAKVSCLYRNSWKWSVVRVTVWLV